MRNRKKHDMLIDIKSLMPEGRNMEGTMKLEQLLEGLTYRCEAGNTEREVAAVVNDSRKLCKDCLFLCIVGANFDGHSKAMEAVEKGAAVLVVSKELPKEVLDSGITVIRVEDTRYAMAFISAAWFGHPARKLTTIGITGTKGKTTTTYLVKSILEHAGHKEPLRRSSEINTFPLTIRRRNPICYRIILPRW